MVYPHTFRTEYSETKTTNSMYGAYYAFLQSKKIRVQPQLLKILGYVDSNRNTFISDLAEAIKIKSVSASLKHIDDVLAMIAFTEKWMIKLGIKYECFNIGFQTLEGKKTRLPPVILASLGWDPRKVTLCVYTYLDLKETDESEWSFDPWTLVSEEKTVYGYGVASGKSVLMCWFHMIQAFQHCKIELPVNLKFIIESMNHQKSVGLEDFLATRKQDFIFDIEYVVCCDSEWIGEKYPCLIYGTVGVVHFELTVKKKENSATEPRDDMDNLFRSICDEEENILIPHFNEFVQQITPDEEKTYESIQEFDPDEIRDSLPPRKRGWSKLKLLMNFWRLPSIYLDDIQECTCEPKDTTMLKRHFFIKTVPRQTVDKSESLVLHHVSNRVKKEKIENEVNCKMVAYTRTWCENFRSDNYEAARRATIQIYKEDPSMIREDTPRVVLTILNRLIEKNVLFLPLWSKETYSAEKDQNVPKRNIIEGTKLLAAYVFQLAIIVKKNREK